MRGVSSSSGAARPVSADRERDPHKLSRAPECGNCHGPLPPPAWTGRPRIYCSERCRDEAAAIRCFERERLDQERRAAEEADRATAERRRNLRAGGVRRLEQLQIDAWDARRCGWFEASDEDVCQRRVTRAYLLWCREHTDREEKLEEEALEAEVEALEAEEAKVGRGSPQGRRGSPQSRSGSLRGSRDAASGRLEDANHGVADGGG